MKKIEVGCDIKVDGVGPYLSVQSDNLKLKDL